MTTYYQNKETGNDCNDGLTLETAFKSGARASECLGPGDKLLTSTIVDSERVINLSSITLRHLDFLDSFKDMNLQVEEMLIQLKCVPEAAKDFHVCTALTYLMNALDVRLFEFRKFVTKPECDDALG